MATRRATPSSPSWSTPPGAWASRTPTDNAGIDAARDVLERDLLPSLGARFTLEPLAFGEEVTAATPAELSATGRRSDLAEALAAVRERSRGRPVAGIVLLSDGGDTSGTAEREIQREATPPVFPIGFGSRTVGRDREVLSVTAAETVLDDSRVDLAVSAVSHGHGTDPIELRLLENGRPIEVRRVAPAGDGTPVRAVFQVVACAWRTHRLYGRDTGGGRGTRPRKQHPQCHRPVALAHAPRAVR